MMAALGAVVQHYVKFPGFEGVPAGLDAVITAPGTYGALVMFPGSTFHCLDVISAFSWLRLTSPARFRRTLRRLRCAGARRVD